jgi:plastocyanin
MRRLPILSLVLLTTVAIAACSAGGAPGWTYAPAPSATPVASGAASGAPSAGASAAPSPAPSVAPSVAPSASSAGSATPSGGAAGLTVTAAIGATTGGFVPTTLETAAGTAFGLTFDNQDNQAPHNLILQNPDGSAVAVEGDTAFFTGPGQRVYQVPALTAGAYKYICQVHPTTMVGTLTAQ